MSEDYLAQQPTAIWNAVSGVWEKPGTANLFCAHLELYSEVWPTSGMMRDGVVYELPMQVRHIADFESSSLPTPTTRDYKDGSAPHERNGEVQTDTVARAIFNSGEVLLPTVKARDAQAEGYEAGLRRSQPQVGTIVKGIIEADERVLLPTTRTSMKNGATSKEIEAGNPKSRIEAEVLLGDISWGKFEPAIRRWEQVLGRPAPAPTKPDGKDGAHRLSSKFTEWMMGLPDGWITGHGLSRNDELKMAGNGVVPQQAELALRILLDGVEIVPAER